MYHHTSCTITEPHVATCHFVKCLKRKSQPLSTNGRVTLGNVAFSMPLLSQAVSDHSLGLTRRNLPQREMYFVHSNLKLRTGQNQRQSPRKSTSQALTYGEEIYQTQPTVKEDYKVGRKALRYF